jgi:DNA-binding response OmpR family regulator
MSAPRGVVLLVEDREAPRITTMALLEDEGFVVEVAASFGEALSALDTGRRCDVVLLDRDLGDGDGADLIPLVRKSWPEAKTILVSGEAANVEVDAVVPKGQSFDTLLRILESLLGLTR